MSRHGSNSGAVNPTPLTTAAAEQAPESTQPADALSSSELEGGPPFGDWREQLRDRVREIRARKLVDKRPLDRPAGGLSNPADAARSEKLQTARDHAAAMTDAPTPDSHGEPAEPDELANLMDALLSPPEGLEPLIGSSTPAPEQDDAEPDGWPGSTSVGSLDNLPVETPATVAAANLTALEPAESETQAITEDGVAFAPADEDEATADSPSAESSLGFPELDESAPPLQEASASPPSDAVPLFQDDAQLIDNNPLNEIIEESTETPDVEPQEGRKAPPPLDGFRTETPGWAKLEKAVEDSPSNTQPAPPPDLDAIPNDLSEVDIPAWAMPRQRDDEAAAAFADNAPGQLNADALLAGDSLEGTSTARKIEEPPKVDASADKSPLPPVAADPAKPSGQVESDGLIQRDIHIIGEYSAGSPPMPRPSSDGVLSQTIPSESKQVADRNSSTAAGVVPPAEPPAVKPESESTPQPDLPPHRTPSRTESQPDPPTGSSPQELAGAVPEHAEPEEEASRRVPGLFDPEKPAFVEPATPHEEEDSPMVLEPQPETDAAMEWDLEAPSDPDMILDAQRDPMDPTAPMSDRVFSALADALVLTTIAVLLMLGGASAAGTGAWSFVQAAPVPFIVVWLIFGLGYGIFFVGTCGQTLGKMAMRIRVIGSNRFRVGYGKATLRTLSYAAAMLPAGLGLVLALKDVEHRALHDRLSGTRVVKA